MIHHSYFHNNMLPKRQKEIIMKMDLQQKLLEDYADVFSDILNVLLFDGAQIIQPDELEDFLPKSQYKAEKGILHEEERDVAKRWKNSQFRIATIGLENQARYYKFMPLRVIGYDGANYREQLLEKKVKRAYPVISIVLNFSMHRWKSYLNLKDCLDIPDCLQPYVNDYRIHVRDIAFLTDEQIALFRSDFRIVAQYFADRRKKRTFRFPKKVPAHVDEVLKLLSAVTGDQRFTEGWIVSEEKEVTNMGEKWIDEIENRGIILGEVKAYHRMGKTDEEIAVITGKPVDSIRDILRSLSMQPVKG